MTEPTPTATRTRKPRTTKIPDAATAADYDAAWHVEGGPVEKGNLVKFQIRPDPLAR